MTQQSYSSMNLFRIAKFNLGVNQRTSQTRAPQGDEQDEREDHVGGD